MSLISRLVDETGADAQLDTDKTAAVLAARLACGIGAFERAGQCA